MASTDAIRTTVQPVPLAWRIADAVAKFLRALRHRREFYRLAEMSDTELSDIGLTRSDLNVVVDLPFTDDPTARLGSLAEARRHAIETMARRVS
jgi:uncharacterized protein YjiS (DUF1127 family)